MKSELLADKSRSETHKYKNTLKNNGRKNELDKIDLVRKMGGKI